MTADAHTPEPTPGGTATPGPDATHGPGGAESRDASAAHATQVTGAAPAPAAAQLDWRQALADRRFMAARQAYIVSGGTDQATLAALGALSDVQELVHERSFDKAVKRIERQEQPAPLVPWPELIRQLEALKAAAAQLDRRDPDAAGAALAELPDDNWFPSEYLTQLGTVRIYDSDLAAAQTAFEAAVALDPKHYRALTNLGNVALEQGRVDAAIEHYQAALKVNEDFSNAHHNLGVAYRRKGHLNKSVKSLRRAQRAQQKREAAVARESLGKWTGASGSKFLKYLLWGAAAVGAYLILKAAGYL